MSRMVKLLNSSAYDINVIIGFRGRHDFIAPLLESFQDAYVKYKNTGGEHTCSFTFVEHDAEPSALNQVQAEASYIWSNKDSEGQYNRSFAYNLGVKYGNKARYYLLHDIDILVQSNFFIDLFSNLERTRTRCLQSYGNRHVWYLSKTITDSLLSGQTNINAITSTSDGVYPPTTPPILAVAMGGSILVEHDLFYLVGGFDQDIFSGYAPEDQMFWAKINTISNIGYADNPKIDLFHMWHQTAPINPDKERMRAKLLEFHQMTHDAKLRYIADKRELLHEL